MRLRGLWKLPDGKDWLWGKLGLALVGKANAQEIFNPILADGWGCVPAITGGVLATSSKGLMLTCCTSQESVSHYCQPMPPLETPGYSQTSLAQSLLGLLLLSPGSCCAQSFVCALKESVSPVLWKFCNQIPLVFKVKFLGGSQSLC